MSGIEKLRQVEAEREAIEQAARRRWESMDRQRTEKDMLDMEFDDELLEEIESEATK